MPTQIKSTLKSLLESSEGLHLTAYIRGKGKISETKAQIIEFIREASDHLSAVLTNQEEKRFLAPLHGLLRDDSMIRKINGSMGLFRTKKSFRVINLPVKVEPTCVVATSFHVKPLLRWMQTDRNFTLVGLDDFGAHLYRGSLNSLKKIGEYKYSSRFSLDWLELKHTNTNSVQRKLKGKKLRCAIAAVADWADDEAGNLEGPLYIAGKRNLTKCYLEESDPSSLLNRHIIGFSFAKDKVSLVSAEVRAHLKTEIMDEFERNLVEFHHADSSNTSKKNIFDIARAAISGRVKKLLISDGIKLFGKMDKKTGILAIHSGHLDHEDDDLLDDLAQEVLSQGGEILVADPADMPNGQAILALVKGDGEGKGLPLEARLSNYIPSGGKKKWAN